MKTIILYSFWLFLWLFSNSLYGQDIHSSLLKEINSLRQNKYAAINIQSLLKYDNKDLLDSLKKYDNDSLSNVRFNIQLVEYKIAQDNPKDTAIQHEVVYRLVRGINDPDNYVRQNALNILLACSASDFDNRSVDSLNKIIRSSDLTRDLILLIGVADIKEYKDLLLSKVKSSPLNQLSDFYSADWAMHLALARMGDTENIEYCIKTVNGFSDEISKIIFLLYDIAYIRREAAIEYLRGYLNNEKRLPSVKVTVEGTQYCQYALDAIAPVIEDFPVQARGIGYTDEEIETARKWLDTHSQYKIKR